MLYVKEATPYAQIFAGNESYPLFNGATGWVKLITPYAPVKVNCYGSPTFTESVIPSGFNVTPGTGSGLICVATPDPRGRVDVLSQSLSSSSSSSDSSFLAVLTDKDYRTSEFVVYSWVKVTDQITPGHPVTYTKTATFGCYGNFPAYHVRNFDVPVQQGIFGLTNETCSLSDSYTEPIDQWAVVRMWKGDGDFYLFNSEPHVNLFRRTGVVDTDGEIGFERLFDQETQTWYDGREVRIVSTG
jgi:hypothetical protein